MSNKEIRVVVVDDHAILLSGLCMMLNAEDNMEVVGQAGTAAEALEVVRDKQPDLVLLDISIPGDSGLDIIADLLRLAPDSRIIILTMHNNREYVKKALAEGATGFVLKKGLDVDLFSAIAAVMRGEIYIHPSLLRDYLEGEGDKSGTTTDSTDNDRLLWDSLSRREQQVLLGVARGLTSREIAGKYFISEKTVATYRSRAQTKLGVTSRARLVELALKLKLLQ